MKLVITGATRFIGSTPVSMSEFFYCSIDPRGRRSRLRIESSFGEMSEIVLNRQRALPETAEGLGYRFKYTTVADAVRLLALQAP
jgi:NAD dependent epimerase/dehydratase family enzyme